MHNKRIITKVLLLYYHIYLVNKKLNIKIAIKNSYIKISKHKNIKSFFISMSDYFHIHNSLQNKSFFIHFFKASKYTNKIFKFKLLYS